jgi:hypothetical protein
VNHVVLGLGPEPVDPEELGILSVAKNSITSSFIDGGVGATELLPPTFYVGSAVDPCG